MAGFGHIDGRFPLIWAAALVFLFLAGCTESERSGFSSIPQNTPTSWEMSPYGELRN